MPGGMTEEEVVRALAELSVATAPSQTTTRLREHRGDR